MRRSKSHRDADCRSSTSRASRPVISPRRLAALLGKDAGWAFGVGHRAAEGWLAGRARTLGSRRDLSARRYVYVWVMPEACFQHDGIHLQARLEDEAQCILVIIGATSDGQKGIGRLGRWRPWRAPSGSELLLDLKRRGLGFWPPSSSSRTVALGFWKAVGEVWSKMREQRCGCTRLRNPQRGTEELKPGPSPPCRTSGWPRPGRRREGMRRFIEAYSLKYDKAIECLKRIATIAGVLRFPAEHWKHLRTTNPIESAFATVRHRTIRSRVSLQQDRPCHDLQAGRGRRETWRRSRTSPVAKGDRGCDVQRWNRSRPTDPSS